MRGSIPDQLRDCKATIALDPARQIVGEYTDEAFSAYTANRGPGLVTAMRAVEDLAREGQAAELWAQHSDRLARGDGKSARHAVEIALWALKQDVRVRTIQDPDTFRDLLYAVVTGQRNHEDSRRKGLAVAAGRRRAAVRGDYLGYRPDGYQATTTIDDAGRVRKRLVIDAQRQPVIEKVFRMALRGASMGAIARALNRSGWLTKPFFRTAKPKPWTAERVRVVLRNPRYAGLSVVKGEVVASGHWPAYITPRQYARLEARWANRSSRGRRRRPSETYLLARLATCGRCGAPLVARTQQQRNDGTFDRRYRCARNTQRGDVASCEMMSISADLIETMFVASLSSLLLDGERAGDELPTAIATPAVNPLERQRVIEAACTGDHRQIDLALADVIASRAPEAALLRRMAMSRRHGPELEMLLRFENWAEQEQVGRTQATREEAKALNGVLHNWFSSVVITADNTSVSIATIRGGAAKDVVSPWSAEVRFDVQGWMRLAPQAKRLRRPHARWTDAEILGALEAWADSHGRPPAQMEWRKADGTHPCAKLVASRFKTWTRALKQAGLEPATLAPLPSEPMAPETIRPATSTA
jgi:hypothetical protein